MTARTLQRFSIRCVINTIPSCDPMCQIREISSLFGTVGHKQSRWWDFRTYPNFSDHYLKRSIPSVYSTDNNCAIDKKAKELGKTCFTNCCAFECMIFKTERLSCICQCYKLFWTPFPTDTPSWLFETENIENYFPLSISFSLIMMLSQMNQRNSTATDSKCILTW